MEKLLAPIPEELIVEKVGQLKGWKRKRVPFEDGQTKSNYITEMIGGALTLSVLRDLRSMREHSRIADFKWRIFSWDRSLARYFPDLIEKKFKTEILKFEKMVSLDKYIVDEESQTVFILLEQWRKKAVADTFLSRVETNVPEYFRAYLSIEPRMLFVQEKSREATQRFVDLFTNAFNASVEEERINAMTIRKFVRETKEKIKRLVIRVPQEVAGFGGLSNLILKGEDVLSGSRGLMTRHETSPIDVGPWTGVSSEQIELDIGQAVRITSIEAGLWLLELLKQEF